LTWLRWVNLALAVLTMLAPTAHVLELPNKLSLEANLWLAVQQHLYQVRWPRKIGQVSKLGSPFEKDGPDDGQTEAVCGGVQGESCS